eukprot:5151249-Lingulodinium_polyedra.AAC.1
MEEELSSLDKRDVYENDCRIAPTQVLVKRNPRKKVPARCLLVKKPTHDGKGGWKQNRGRRAVETSSTDQ